MSRYTGPAQKINRRFSQAIFPPSKAFERKPHPPGMHGPRLRRKVSEYSAGLNEKQKLRFMYGLNERQFRLLFERAKAMRGVTGEQFLQLLESRLDNIVYLLGFTKSRRASRQLVNHGHVNVNGHKVDISSYLCKPGDIIEMRERPSSRQLATRGLETNQFRSPPAWLTLQADALRGVVSRLPVKEELEPSINTQLIVEFYSR